MPQTDQLASAYIDRAAPPWDMMNRMVWSYDQCMSDQSKQEREMQVACLQMKSALIQLQAELLRLKGILEDAVEAEYEARDRAQISDAESAEAFSGQLTSGDTDMLAAMRICL